jgi:hypothetical protein
VSEVVRAVPGACSLGRSRSPNGLDTGTGRMFGFSVAKEAGREYVVNENKEVSDDLIGRDSNRRRSRINSFKVSRFILVFGGNFFRRPTVLCSLWIQA